MIKFVKKLLKILFLLIVVGIVIFVFPTQPSESLVLKAKSKIESIENEKGKYHILIDYNRPIFKKRLWVIEMETDEIIINSHVSHAKKSGLIYASEFSNVPNSKKSSIGLFKTQGTYESNYGKGEYKIGMRIKGLEPHNDKVLSRNIVFHPSYGLWSEGCFMTFPKTNKKIIELTKGGSMVFVNKD